MSVLRSRPDVPCRARARMVAVAVVGVALVAGCASGGATSLGSTVVDSPSAGGVASQAAPVVVGDARQALDELAVKGRAPKTGYSREQFGQAWADVDRNGCDTRNDVLRRDITDEQVKSGTRGCVVAAGTLDDPYSGAVVSFVRGQDTSSAVQIDHVVALSDAWQTGAQQLTVDQRTALANDPLNLLAVDGPLNQQKSDADAASWLPPQVSYRCAYVARQVAVKRTYDLWVTSAERDAIAAVLDSCPGQALPTPDEVATPPTAP